MLGILKGKTKNLLAVGVDISADGIALAIRKNGVIKGQPNIKCDYLSLQNPADAGVALAALVDKHQLKGAPAAILLSADKYSLLQTSNPPMERDQLRAAVRWKIGDLISYPVEEAVVDIFEYPAAGQRQGQDTKLYVVSARADDIRTTVAQVHNANLDLKFIDIAELALRNVVSRTEEDSAGVIILSLLEKSGLLLFVQKGEIFLARKLDFGFDDLLMRGQSMHDEVSLELQRSLDYFESQFRQPLPGKLLVFPPEKFSGELISHINNHLNVKAEPLILDQVINCPIDYSEESQLHCLFAVGASLRQDLGDAA